MWPCRALRGRTARNCRAGDRPDAVQLERLARWQQQKVLAPAQLRHKIGRAVEVARRRDAAVRGPELACFESAVAGGATSTLEPPPVDAIEIGAKHRPEPAALDAIAAARPAQKNLQIRVLTVAARRREVRKGALADAALASIAVNSTDAADATGRAVHRQRIVAEFGREVRKRPALHELAGKRAASGEHHRLLAAQELRNALVRVVEARNAA